MSKVGDIWSECRRRLLTPGRCCVCNNWLSDAEEILCHDCLHGLPLLYYTTDFDNDTIRLMWGKVESELGHSTISYKKESMHQMIFSHLKFHSRTDLCQVLGRMIADEAAGLGLFDGVDAIVPVPLHKLRERERGYNQAHHIAIGMAQLTGLPIKERLVTRSRYTERQTLMPGSMRESNVADAFSVNTEEIEDRWKVAPPHLLFIDDTITTGSTIRSVIKEVQRAIPQCRVSVCSVGLAAWE